MYTEELEGFEEEGKVPRTYVSNFSQQDAEKLARENEKLKKSLEKEKFFNRLLDQELKEVKAESAAKYPADYPVRSGVSKGAFYTLLFLALAMAGFIFYTLYNNKQYNLFNNGAAYTPTETGQQPVTEPEQDLTANTDPAPPATDSVPNIIGNNNTIAEEKKTAEVKKQPAAAEPASKKDEYNEAEVEAALKEPVTAAKKPAVKNTPAANTPATNTAAASTTAPPAVQQQPAPQQPSRPVIARYKVTSKANFYNGPDENTLRSAFISAGPNKIVDALDDKNGFIYVEYLNDHGMVSKGWLSKTDLTKAE